MPHDYCSSSIASSFPLGVEELLNKFEDIFRKDPLHGFPPLRGIEHQIDLNLGASLPNKMHIEAIWKRQKRSKGKWRA